MKKLVVTLFVSALTVATMTSALASSGEQRSIDSLLLWVALPILVLAAILAVSILIAHMCADRRHYHTYYRNMGTPAPKYRVWYMFGSNRPHQVWRRERGASRGDVQSAPPPIGGEYGYFHGSKMGDTPSKPKDPIEE